MASGELIPSQVDPAVLASKRVVFVGGLPEEATVAMVRAAMIPFGDIKNVDMPMDYVKGKHRGFAFCEYEDANDAEECIFNMDGAELIGRTIAVSVAQPNQVNKLTSGAPTSTEAIWNSDDWFQQQGRQAEAEAQKHDERENDAKTLQEL